MLFRSLICNFVRAKCNMYCEIMKKSVEIFALTMTLCLGFGSVSMAQVQQHKSVRSEVTPVGGSKAENYAEIKFDTLRVDLGKFPASDPVRKCSYAFTNVGTAPLIIHQAFASCGCTVPSFTKDPTKPGQRGKIDVTYDGTGKFPGKFSKTITIRTNAKNEIVRLIIEGTMTE